MSADIGRLYEDVQELRGNVANLIREVDTLRRECGPVTLRDRFAMASMQGLFACCDGWPPLNTFDEIATRAYKMADSMLAVRGGSQ